VILTGSVPEAPCIFSSGLPKSSLDHGGNGTERDRAYDIAPGSTRVREPMLPTDMRADLDLLEGEHPFSISVVQLRCRL
jgi:hypothetical protein